MTKSGKERTVEAKLVNLKYMKKLMFLVVLGFLISPSVQAETLYGFLNGNLYSVSGELKAFCFGDKNCYNIEGQQIWNVGGVFTTEKPETAVIASTPSPITVTPIPQNTTVIISPTAPPVIQTPTQPVQGTTTPIQATTTPATTPVSPPYTATPSIPYDVGAPSVYTEKYRLMRDGQVVGWMKVGDQYRNWLLNGQIVSTEKTGEKAYLYSYDNIAWFIGSIPHDTEIPDDLNSYGWSW